MRPLLEPDLAECDRKRDELERLLNDPDSRMEPGKVWELLAELSRCEAALYEAQAAS